jgi:tRNA pseudouridine55 synthase
VARVRRLLNTKRVGHGGTLDPLATGVLPIAVGRATRLLQFLPSDKVYRAVIRFGLTTDTDDLEGKTLTQQPVPELTQAAVIAALPQFRGTIQQYPPMYSAIQVQGQRLYDLARQGKSLAELPLRTVTVYDIQAVNWQPGSFPEITLEIACSSGTYIRSIARDLGATLGTGATLAALLRTQSSGLPLETSQTLDTLQRHIEQGSFQPIAPHQALQHLKPVSLSTEDGRRWCQGQRLILPLTVEPETPLCMLDETGTFLGIGLLRLLEGTPTLIAKVVFT